MIGVSSAISCRHWISPVGEARYRRSVSWLTSGTVEPRRKKRLPETTLPELPVDVIAEVRLGAGDDLRGAQEGAPRPQRVPGSCRPRRGLRAGPCVEHRNV